jgi:adenine-specific DNA-methyltransferase
MSENIKTDLILKLKEIFRSDRSDLDFGIYRILNFRRKEIERFIEEDLVKQAEAEFSELVKANFEEQKADLDTLRDEIKRDFPEGTIDERGEVRRLHDAPKIKRYIKLKQSIDDQRQVQTQINEVFNHVYEFFSRYYDKGDFISQRRFGGREKYVIPHNGEEISLYWVNQDQYYIKTSEDYKKYSFNLGEYNITFKLVDAESEKNNNVGADRFFVIHRELPVRFDEENNSLDVFFERRPLTEEDLDFYEILRSSNQNIKFDTIIDKDYDIILDSLRDFSDLTNKIKSSKHASGETPELKHHLIQYYQKNDMDYFIHKNLGHFLRRELEFYLKNEVIDLDETLSKDARNIKLMQLKIGAIKKISEQIITFLDQIENFQRNLFEKKKFVLTTDYCMTLDMVPEEFYLEIIDNQKQLEEWKLLYSFDIEKEAKMLNETFFGHGKNETDKKVEVLKQNLTLIIDTNLYGLDFKYQILNKIDDLDEKITGILIKSENLQSLKLLSDKFKEKIDFCYIDPPYNTGGDEFLYKDNYQHSSWLSMKKDRLEQIKPILAKKGVIFISIGQDEIDNLIKLCDSVFTRYNRIGIITRLMKTGGQKGNFFSPNTEYILVYAKDIEFAEPFREELSEELIKKVYTQIETEGEAKGERYRIMGLYQGYLEIRPNQRYWIKCPDGSYAIPPGNTFPKRIKEGELANPMANDGVWRWTYDRYKKELEKNNIVFIKTTKSSLITPNGQKSKWNIYTKIWLRDRQESGRVPVDLITKYENRHSSIELKKLDIDYSFAKPSDLIKYLLKIHSSLPQKYVIDFFAGSGTTGHSVLKLNKEDNGNRKFILVEMGEFFNSILKSRIVKVIYSENWKNGKPQDNNGSNRQIIKYQTLEQYEDTLNNILFADKGGLVQTALHKLPNYFLQHVLDEETKNSPTRLTIDRFKTPFDYKIITLQGREEKTEPVDLVETFNYLLGIKVKKIRQHENEQTKYIIVYGEKGEEPSCTKVLIIWRKYDENILEKEKQFIEQKIIPQFNPDIIYINVDSLIKGAESIEPKFKELMGA